MPLSPPVIEQILFGCDPTCGVVAVEAAGHFFRLFIRDREGVTLHDRPFRPFILLSEAQLVARSGIPCTIETLTGTGFYRQRAWFDNWHDCSAMAEYLQRSTGAIPTDVAAPYLFISDSSRQFLLQSGVTFFKGLETVQIRCQAIQVLPEEDNSCRRCGNAVLRAVALADTDGNSLLLDARQGGEAELLERLRQLVTTYDPDIVVVEASRGAGLDLLLKRAHQLGVRLGLGRNGSEPHQRRLATSHGSELKWHLYGRLVLDFGMAAANGQELHSGRCERKGEQGAAAFDTVGALLKDRFDGFCRQLPIWQALAGMVPLGVLYGLRRPGLLFQELLLREYLRRGVALPQRKRPAASGAAIEIWQTGVVRPAIHCDLSSLLPSIQVSYRLQAADEQLHLTLPLLSCLLRNDQEVLPEPLHRSDAVALALRLLLKDGAVVLTAGGFFGDAQAAAELLRLRRVLLRDMRNSLQTCGATAVAYDGAGLYVVPPSGHDGTAERAGLSAELNAAMPGEIKREIDSRYQAMIAYQSGSYALLDQHGGLHLKGLLQLTHGHEAYLCDFVHDALKLLLTTEPVTSGILMRLLEQYLRRLANHAFEIGWLARSELLAEAPELYRQQAAQGLRHRSAAYELALSAERSYQAGDRICYYVVGSVADVTIYNHARLAEQYDPVHPDTNTAWYAEKLRQAMERVTAALPAQPGLFG